MAAETAGVLLLGEEEHDDGALRRLCGEAAPEVEVAARRVQVYLLPRSARSSDFANVSPPPRRCFPVTVAIARARARSLSLSLSLSVSLSLSLNRLRLLCAGAGGGEQADAAAPGRERARAARDVRGVCAGGGAPLPLCSLLLSLALSCSLFALSLLSLCSLLLSFLSPALSCSLLLSLCSLFSLCFLGLCSLSLSLPPPFPPSPLSRPVSQRIPSVQILRRAHASLLCRF